MMLITQPGKTAIDFLSKGHSVMGYYVTLSKVGFITDEELLTYGQNDTFLPGHPVINKKKGIESTNGSLGMGYQLE